MFKLLPGIQKSKGQALILAYGVLIVLTILITAFLSKAVNESRLARRHKLTQEATYLAEGGIEDALAQFSSKIANFVIDPAIASYHVDTVYSSFHNVTVPSDIVRLEDADRVEVIEGGAWAYVRNYKVTTTAQHPLNSGIVVTLHQIAARRLIPTFQYTVFYEKDLELLPGPDMNFTGRVHSNSDIYLGANSTLTLDSLYLRSAANIYNKRKDTGVTPGGTVDIRLTPEDPEEYAAMAGLGCEDPEWEDESQTRWGGTVKSATHGVRRVAVPQVQSIESDGYYAEQANIKIVNNTITQGGVELIPELHIPLDTVTETTSFYNNREGEDIKMTEIDLRKLAGYDGTEQPGEGPTFDPHLPTNGLLYATRDDAGALYQPGIRLVNGKKIERDGGLTVVSNDPVYIQGNYNTEDKRPCAVICDSINLLSSVWNDGLDEKSLSKRKAEETTVYIGFIAGIDDTVGSAYNGGLENYPRMHEDWTGKDLNILGAFLALWNSEVATGAWHYGDPNPPEDDWDPQYKAPIRNWDYDSDFNDPSNLPPFTPWAVEMHKIAWWK